MSVSSPASALLEFDSQALGRFLIESSQTTEVDWRLAQEVSRQEGHTPLTALLDLGLFSEDALADQLARWTGCLRWKAADELAPISDVLPRQFMAANSLLLLDPAQGTDEPQRLVCCDPSDHHLWRSVLGQVDPEIHVVFATRKDINAFISDHDRQEQPEVGPVDESLDVSAEINQLRDMASEAPVIRFFNQVIERALELGASDVHLEQFDHRVSLRLRVDGILTDQIAPPPKMFEPLRCRIKIMAGLDIAERRLAQDGRIRMRLRGQMVDLRVSLVPTMYGQDVAIRLQDHQKLDSISLRDLGFTDPQIKQLRTAASKSHGILLVTGPTGSGKTTTLYAMLRTLVNTQRKIVTVEDPIEFAMDGVNQIPVNPAIGLTFGNTLRHVLRHDPDIILIGEIRDHETAQMAFQAALTGHMVLSTLHTNDVPGTFVRLIDIGVEPYLVNAAVEGVCAQRLVRKVCSDCRNQSELREACTTCSGLGYRGRIAIMEFATLGPAVKQAIIEGADEHRLREVLLQSGYNPMRQQAQQLVHQGLTDQAELARVLGQTVVDD